LVREHVVMQKLDSIPKSCSLKPLKFLSKPSIININSFKIPKLYWPRN